MYYKARLTSLTKSVFYLIVMLFFCTLSAQGQSFDPTINPTHWTIDGEVRAGFSTDFSFSAKDVERGWWRYSKAFGRLLNMKTYYRVTIPSEANQGNVDVELLAKVLRSKDGSTFFLTVNGKSLPQSKQKDYLNQVNAIIKDFKKSFYLDILEEQLEKEEKKAKRMSKKVDRASGRAKERALNALTAQEEKLDYLRKKIKTIYQVSL